jgi:hypothetical protein
MDKEYCWTEDCLWQGKTTSSVKDLLEYHFVLHKSHIYCSGIEPEKPSADYLSYNTADISINYYNKLKREDDADNVQGPKEYTDMYVSCKIFSTAITGHSGRAVRHEMSSLARTLGSWVRITLEAWMSVCIYSVLCCSLCR